MAEMTLEQRRALAVARARRARSEQEAPNEPETTEADKMLGSVPGRLALGASELLTGPFRLGAHIGDKITEAEGGTPTVGPWVEEKLAGLEEMKRRGMKARGAEGYDIAGLVGNVAGGVGGMAGMAIPKALMGQAKQGAGIGATFGATQHKPDEGRDYFEGLPTETITGAIAGGVLPPLVGGASNLYHGVKNILNIRPEGLAVRAASGKIREVTNALEGAKSKVPGVEYTAGQASTAGGSPEFSALMKRAEAKDPALFMEIDRGHELAREGLLSKVSGTKKALDDAFAARSAAGDRNYVAAFDVAVKRDKGLRELWKNPFFKAEVGEAAKLLKASAQRDGVKKPIAKNLTEFLHYVKEGIDERLMAVGPSAPAISQARKNALKKVKEDLLEWIEGHNSEYGFARTEHIRLSEPIEKMKLGQQLEGTMKSSLGQERDLSFANAIRSAEGKISKNTGKPVIDALDQAERDILEAIKGDFRADRVYTEMASRGKSSMVERTKPPELPPTGFFQPFVSAARGWVNRIAEIKTEKAVAGLAALARHPGKLAEAMKKASPKERQRLQALLHQVMRVGVITKVDSLKNSTTKESGNSRE